MKIHKLVFAVLLATSTLISCKSETQNTNEVLVQKEPNPKKIALAISGMTCEIGCAKTIQSKLSKMAGITNAKVIFTDSLGLVEYDANQISAKEIETFVNGIAGGDLYTVKEVKEVLEETPGK
ncbi:hypothetical protein GCM10011416_09380 [Polaribacter pacificus]|uniref:HMA domain-containing protein n=1 Tax=Polaribacter pacificus TaxID=1775173 RepID=A0A917MD69_9FLAO|nr:heavy metal-associated domain-containing protein [Polaribacter pacificus]GGG94205.1 hypothetical protein GCM10011416_09380 [Polaribacter pacificus]